MDIPSTELPKPPVPYLKGWRFTVQSYIPPPPTPVTRGCCRNFKAGREERSQLSPIERCLRNPPLSGKIGSDTLQLQVIDQLRVGDGSNAQVFTVQVVTSTPGLALPDQKMVAKVYDPLYFNDEEGYANPFLCTNEHYTHEVAAYKLLTDLQGESIPRFYGSYSLDIPVEDIPVDGLGSRTVRLILVEHIPGITMRDADPKDFSQTARQELMKSIIDFDTLIFHQADIVNRDNSPRNVIMHPDGRLIHIDFANTSFNRGRDPNRSYKTPGFFGQYISPLLRWTDKTLAWDFLDWIDWDWTLWVEAEYAHTADTITPEMRQRMW
ncbi:hypothetical protein ASPWEDRAFT_739380 [Aspergillus wentii DTO 134E9]|uniref:Protein kinase domain-containing protein n=1 Tax=Aspergillus wentii DTO 134E9 TaxID=1073089 RepID=A0A1L9RID5_ASPWE|nr:uncharacterized protein ASPWEDRAFT_739380 [Aspergillus wentii DTO 134E9]KAI9932345.1 hypothetical protein MW887_009858 [Aspergillus wentii]OJJ34689.1 hypothetical protein ASPWEDRAFT_739380 [Aspergillus wentii DTO 134E9]